MDDPQKPRRKFLFKVDILIEEETNGLALETLLHLLNSDKVEDYQVKEGVELGKKIEYALKEAISKRHVKPFPAASHLKVPPENTEAPQTPGGIGSPPFHLGGDEEVSGEQFAPALVHCQRERRKAQHALPHYQHRPA